MWRDPLTQRTSPWWSPSVHQDRRPLLMARNAILARLRRYFAEEGFVEIDAAALQVSPGNETHIHAIAADIRLPDGKIARRYLHTSPEFAMKKLLAAGESRIFSLGHVFRDRERGALHAAEFTMLEWYRSGDSYELVMQDCMNVLRLAAEAVGTLQLNYRRRMADPANPAARVAIADAFAKYASIDLLATCRSDGTVDRDALAAQARHVGVTVSPGDSWSDLFSRILVSLVEPELGNERIAILHEYPRSEAALAALSERDPRLADRFEIYACGVELANGFRELTDPGEQRRRFEADMAEKHRIYGEDYPIDEEFLEALAIMPAASGVALGVDRLVMLATAAPSIHHVIWTPNDDEGGTQ
jgi:elongation factor P--(R)-beta-lysine ligase